MKKLFLLVILFTTITTIKAQSGDGDVFTIEPKSGKCPLIVTFTDVTGEFIAWDWDWDDGTPHGTTNPCVHPFTKQGDYIVVLTVTDNGGSKFTFTGMVYVYKGTSIVEFTPTIDYNNKYDVYDVTGRFIGNDIKILKNGVYFIKQKIGDKYYNKKIVIMR